ncbi:MAG: hypothetical protein HYY37_01230 [Candidatus Aenigmarchaeota archaeon]|nr:hypothetical protein [Candidatus Aenigmarchaeota archaeon]
MPHAYVHDMPTDELSRTHLQELPWEAHPHGTRARNVICRYLNGQHCPLTVGDAYRAFTDAARSGTPLQMRAYGEGLHEVTCDVFRSVGIELPVVIATLCPGTGGYGMLFGKRVVDTGYRLGTPRLNGHELRIPVLEDETPDIVDDFTEAFRPYAAQLQPASVSIVRDGNELVITARRQSARTALKGFGRALKTEGQ